MAKLVGDMRAQAKWVLTITAAAAGLQLFSIAGPMGEFLADTIHRIVIGYQAVFSKLWQLVSYVSGVDFSIYRNDLTFSAIILSPYVIKWRHLSLSPFFEDQKRILSFLNLVCVSVISANISSNNRTIFTNERWLIWLYVLPFSVFFLVMAARSYRSEPDYRPVIKLAFFGIALIFTIVGLAQIFIDYQDVLRVYQPFPLIFTTVLGSTAYLFGVMFRVDGYYPFLLSSIFYIVFFAINYFMLHVAPSVDGFLDSIGA